MSADEIKVDAFEQLGGYDESLRENYLEDLDIAELVNAYCKETGLKGDAIPVLERKDLIAELVNLYDFYSDDNFWWYLRDFQKAG